jgi:hypothetical protein
MKTQSDASSAARQLWAQQAAAHTGMMRISLGLLLVALQAASASAAPSKKPNLL